MITLARLFDTYAQAMQAVNALKSAGVPSDNISILSRDEEHVERHASAASEGASVGSGVGFLAGGAGGLLAGLGMIAIPGIGPVVAAGWLASLLAGAAAGTVLGGTAGGLIGALSGSDTTEDEAHVLAEGLKRGGTVLTVRVDKTTATEIESLLDGFSSVDLDQRKKELAQTGWSGFNSDMMY